MAKKFEASQSVWFVARVMGAKKEEKETKSGKKYVEYNLTTRLPEGNNWIAFSSVTPSSLYRSLVTLN